MRIGGWVVLAMLGGCDSPIRQIGPGTLDNTSGTDPSGTGTGGLKHCDQRAAAGECKEYGGAAWSDGAIAGDCLAGASDGACPRDGMIGYCVYGAGADLQYSQFYYEGGYYEATDAAFLQTDCEIVGGAWYGAAGGDMG